MSIITRLRCDNCATEVAWIPDPAAVWGDIPSGWLELRYDAAHAQTCSPACMAVFVARLNKKARES